MIPERKYQRKIKSGKKILQIVRLAIKNYKENFMEFLFEILI